VEQAEKKQHGGYRPGAGRKPKYGTKTVVMRVPEDRVQEVQNLLGGRVEFVTESTNPDSEKLSRIREVLVRWRGKLSDKRGPLWGHVHELLDELGFVECVTESSEKL
jgi:hypothetical protein